MYTHTFLTAQRLYKYLRCYQMILRVKHVYGNWEKCDVLTGYVSLGCRAGDDWANT